MFEEKLRNVRGKLVEILDQGELEERQYWQTTYRLLRDEGIVEGPYKGPTCEVAVRLATGLRYKLHAKEYWGFEKRYVALEGKELSKEAQEDLRKYSELEKSTRDYLKEKIGKTPVLKEELEKMVEDYLMNQTDLPKIASKEKQREILIRIGVGLQYRKEFEIKEAPETIGRYNIDSLESALDKL